MRPSRRRVIRWPATLALSLLISFAAAPVFAWQVETLGGDRRDLQNEFTPGRPALVFIWSLSCVTCEQQKPLLEAFFQEHGKAGRIDLLGLVLDGPAFANAIAERVREGPMSFPNFVALDDVIARQLEEATGKRLLATPSYLLYDANGQFVGMHTGVLAAEQLVSLVAGGQ